MLPISLKQLVTITPLNNKTKQKILDALPTMSESQQFLVSTQCWQAISMSYQVLVKAKQDQMFDEMVKGKTTYEKKDFQNAENEIFNKLLVKIDETQSAEEVKTLKHQLLHEGS
ncbi:MAG: hypothetical protein ABIJ43_02970 [Candidatus Beckwithbacteria bacterium]